MSFELFHDEGIEVTRIGVVSTEGPSTTVIEETEPSTNDPVDRNEGVEGNGTDQRNGTDQSDTEDDSDEDGISDLEDEARFLRRLDRSIARLERLNRGLEIDNGGFERDLGRLERENRRLERGNRRLEARMEERRRQRRRGGRRVALYEGDGKFDQVCFWIMVVLSFLGACVGSFFIGDAIGFGSYCYFGSCETTKSIASFSSQIRLEMQGSTPVQVQSYFMTGNASVDTFPSGTSLFDVVSNATFNKKLVKEPENCTGRNLSDSKQTASFLGEIYGPDVFIQYSSPTYHAMFYNGTVLSSYGVRLMTMKCDNVTDKFITEEIGNCFQNNCESISTIETHEEVMDSMEVKIASYHTVSKLLSGTQLVVSNIGRFTSLAESRMWWLAEEGFVGFNGVFLVGILIIDIRLGSKQAPEPYSKEFSSLIPLPDGTKQIISWPFVSMAKIVSGDTELEDVLQGRNSTGGYLWGYKQS